MTQLFTHYSVSEIILFIIIFAVAVKKLIDFADWAKTRAKQAVKQAEKPSYLEQAIKRHDDELSDIKKELSDIKELVNLLIQSDKDDIKQSITQAHHYFCYKLKSIDDYSLDCLEKRYSHYTEEGGNSFVETLIQELRALPRNNK